MEEIFNKKRQAEELRRDGFSIREIGKKLNISKTEVGRLVVNAFEVSQAVPKLSQNVPDLSQSVPTAPQGNKEQSLSKQEIERILKEFEENLLEKVESAVKDKVQRAINYYTNNLLDNVIECKIKEITRGND